MSFLLKIVQGPNSGAEIALLEGTTVSFGSGDECDIILSDSALEKKAFEIEVTSERVMLLFPNGKQSRLEEYYVRTIGTTSIVLGPGEGAWQDIIWKKTKNEESSEEKSSADEVVENEEPRDVASTEEEHPKKKKRSLLSRIIWFIVFLIFILLFVAIGIWYFAPKHLSKWTNGKSDEAAEFVKPHATKVWGTMQEWLMSEKEKAALEEARNPRETLDDLIKEYNLAKTEKSNGVIKLKGNFKVPADRLKATARVYRAQKGVMLDFVDAQTMKGAIDGVLSLFDNNALRVIDVENRVANLTGEASSIEELQQAIDLIIRELPKVEKVECSQVKVYSGVVDSIVENREDVKASVAKREEEKKAMPKKAPELVAMPKLPVVGILSAPYPCLVLQSGMRIMEGAKFGDFIVEKITTESVELLGVNGRVTWRP